MRLVNKTAFSKFNNKQYTMENFLDTYGRNPTHMGAYMKFNSKKHPQTFLSIAESMGNIYEMDGAMTKGKSLDSIQFTWDMCIDQLPTVKITRDAVQTNPYDAFPIYLEADYYAASEVFYLRDNSLLYVISPPERINDQEVKYMVKSLNPGIAITPKYLMADQTTLWSHNLQPEFSEYVPVKDQYNVEKMTNYMMKFRADFSYSSDWAATSSNWIASDSEMKKAEKGQNYKLYYMTSPEKKAFDNFQLSVSNGLIFNRTTVDEATHQPYIAVNGAKKVWSGDGLIAQYERYAQIMDVPTKLTLGHLRSAMDYVCERKNESSGINIVFAVNRILSRRLDYVLNASLNVIVPSNNGTWFWSKSQDIKGTPKREYMPNDLTVGASFSSYIWAGNTITFMVDEALTQRYPDRAYGIMFDNDLYEDEGNMVPNIQIVTLKDKHFVKNTIAGAGGLNGTTSGAVATSIEGSHLMMIGWRGVMVKNPYKAVIMQENKM